MKIYYKFDEDGYFLPGEDFISLLAGQTPEGNFTDKPPTIGGKGMYKPRFVNGQWVEEGQAPEQGPQPPTTDEKVAALEQQNEQLKNSVAFLEDMVVILTMP